MSDRDRFADLSQKALSQQDMTQQDRQFWIEYILRFLKDKKAEDYALGDILEWNFTGDNIIFTQDGLQIPLDQISNDYVVDITLTGTGTIYADAVYVSSNYIYVGGRFETIGGVSSNNIARFDRTTGTWTAMSGIDFSAAGRVNDICVSSGGTVYICGYFNISASPFDFAKWNGTSWDGIAGPNSVGYALKADASDNVYLGGEFTTCGVSNTGGISLYDGSNFTAVGTGMTSGDGVYGIDLDSSGNLYAVGYLTVAGGVTVVNVAKWDGANWTAMGSGVGDGSDYAECIVIDSNDVIYVGGYFKTPPYLVKWAGTGWSAVGGGVTGDVRALEVDEDDNLIVVGNFTAPFTRAAKWTGSGWKKVGDGFLTQQRDVAVDSNGVLYIVGFN